MVSRDYTKEIGVDVGAKKVSKRVAIPILALAAAAVSAGVVTLVQGSATTHHSSAPTKTAAAT